MGRIKTAQIKRITHELIKRHGSKLSGSFEKNQEIITGLISTTSKKLRNKIAGYATRLVKKSQNTEE